VLGPNDKPEQEVIITASGVLEEADRVTITPAGEGEKGAAPSIGGRDFMAEKMARKAVPEMLLR